MTADAWPGAPHRVIAQLARAAEIVTVLSATGFTWLVHALGLGAGRSPRCLVSVFRPGRRCPQRAADVPLPERLRQAAERLGPTFIKAGQMLALRPDYVPLEYAEALRSLHTQAAPFGAEEAAGIVEAELGAPLAELYAEFDRQPFAAASLSQVHRARLHDGRSVAVKVQRPGVAEQVERDLGLLEVLARRFERHQPRFIAFRPSEAVAELAEYTRRELNFRREARTAEQLRELLADDDQIVIPAVIGDRSSGRVLTTEFLDGLPPAPAADLRQAGLDPVAGMRAGATAMLRQVFQFGLFHADPHPGNVLFLPGDRIGFLDFGMFGRLSPSERQRIALIFWAFIEGDYEAIGGQLLRLSESLPCADPRGFRSAVAESIEEWVSDQGAQLSIARLLLHELALGARHGVAFPRGLMLLGRALVNLEATARVIDPGFNLTELAVPLLEELRHILLPSPQALREHWHHHRFEYLDLAIELPRLLPEAITRLHDGHARPALPAPQQSGHRWLQLGAAFATGAGLAALAGKHRRLRHSPHGKSCGYW